MLSNWGKEKRRSYCNTSFTYLAFLFLFPIVEQYGQVETMLCLHENSNPEVDQTSDLML